MFKTALFIITALISFSHPAFAEEEVAAEEITIEERVMMSTFMFYQSGLAFDEVCNKTDPVTRHDFNKPENVNLMGNQQMLAARIGNLMQMRLPKETIDQLVERLVKITEKAKIMVTEGLNKYGCESQNAKNAKQSYALFAQNHPSQVSAIIDNEIIKQGGSITAPANTPVPKEEE